MNRQNFLKYPVALAAVIFGALAASAEIAPPAPKISDHQPELSLLLRARHSLEEAFKFDAASQLPNGSWKDDPAITALVVYSYLLAPAYSPDEKTNAVIQNGFKYLESCVQPDGGIYQKGYTHYITSVCLIAFTESGLEKYKKIIADAKKYLIDAQCDEGEGLGEDHKFYGGFGYTSNHRADLSNTQFALEAIRAAEVYEKHFASQAPDAKTMENEEQKLGLHWKKALIFLARCQNVKEVNNMPYATDDGGFIYETGTYKEERSHSYGSMTYAGTKSLIYAKVAKDDVRVKKATDWIKEHYTWDENPGFGTASIYYYFMTATKCLDVLGDDVIVDMKGEKHHWRPDVVNKLLSLQKEEGCWANDDGRYWENIKELATAYSVISMKMALKGMEK